MTKDAILMICLGIFWFLVFFLLFHSAFSKEVQRGIYKSIRKYTLFLCVIIGVCAITFGILMEKKVLSPNSSIILLIFIPLIAVVGFGVFYIVLRRKEK